MSVRRLHHEQPDHFAFSPENAKWANEQLEKYPEVRKASAVIPLLWRAQEQEGWLTKAAIEAIAEMLDMPNIRVLEVATFYTMFQLQPVGKKAHIQVCGTTPCMLRGSEDIINICKKRITSNPHELSQNGDFSWEEVECLGACVNAPMVQIFKDTYEDLTPEIFEKLLSDIEAGLAVTPGPQNDRYFSEPEGGATNLTSDDLSFGPKGGGPEAAKVEGSAAVMHRFAGFSINGVDGGQEQKIASSTAVIIEETIIEKPASQSSLVDLPLTGEGGQTPNPIDKGDTLDETSRPVSLALNDNENGDDLKRIKGVGQKIEGILHELGIYYFHQIAAWNAENVAWIDGYLKFKGRIERENWIEQAVLLAKGGETEFSKRVDAGEVPSSSDTEHKED